MLTLLFHFFDYAYYKSTKSKGDVYKYIKKWQLISLVTLSLVATLVYITGCVFVFQADPTMPYVFQTGAVLYAILELSILAGIFQLPTTSLATRARTLMVLGGVATIRIIWSLASTWSVSSKKSRFSPFRDSANGVWTHLAMVLVMELLVSAICCSYAESIDNLPSPSQRAAV